MSTSALKAVCAAYWRGQIVEPNPRQVQAFLDAANKARRKQSR